MSQRQHVFAQRPIEDAVYHDPVSGRIDIEGGAELNYRFDPSDGSVKIEIPDLWLWDYSIDHLIAILEGMKTRLHQR